MISLSNITKQYGPRILFVDASFRVDAGEKVGLVGPNGAGKTTLFRMILGEESPDEGVIERPKRMTIGCFRQDVGDWRGRSILEETISAAGEVSVLGAELAVLEAKLADTDASDYDQILERYCDVQQRFTDLDGYNLPARAAAILAGLGLGADVLHNDVGTLSGGWKMRVALAQILLMRPEILLLDEPTNYLDIESILWLEDFLRAYPGAVVMTCHDQEVMNRVVSRIVEIDGGTMRSYTGDYAFYEAQRQLEATQREAAYERQQAMLAKELRFIERFKAQPSKASQVQSRAKKVDKIERIEPPKRFVARRFEFRKCARSGDEVIKVKGLTKRYGARAVHDKLDLLVRRGERWAVMGENGAGKSTLLKMMSGSLPPDGGAVDLGANVEMSFFAQHQLDQLVSDRTVFEELEVTAPAAGIGTLRNLAGAFGFSGDDIDKRVSVLSGGEKTRLMLAKILFHTPNLLVLDEPTNHLDIATKRALTEALADYDGTLVFVSHDRAFLKASADRILELAPKGPVLYPGSYDEYVTAAGREAPGMRVIKPADAKPAR